jgi:hypothetical protein
MIAIVCLASKETKAPVRSFVAYDGCQKKSFVD